MMNVLKFAGLILFFTFLKLELEAISINPEQYEGKLVSLADCKIPDEEMDKENYIWHDMKIYKKNRQSTLIRANYTIARKFGPIRTNINTYEVINTSQRNKVMDLMDLPCEDRVVTAVANLLHIGYTKDCYILPGEYSFSDFDFNTITKFLFILWRVGRYSFEIDFKGPKGKVACFYLVVDYVKRKNKKITKK